MSEYEKYEAACLATAAAREAYTAARGTDKEETAHATYREAQKTEKAASAAYYASLKEGEMPVCYDPEYSKTPEAGEPLTDEETAARGEITEPREDGIPGVTIPCPKCGTYCHGDCES